MYKNLPVYKSHYKYTKTCPSFPDSHPSSSMFRPGLLDCPLYLRVAQPHHRTRDETRDVACQHILKFPSKLGVICTNLPFLPPLETLATGPVNLYSQILLLFNPSFLILNKKFWKELVPCFLFTTDGVFDTSGAKTLLFMGR
jgi:hypothetical protein